MRGHDEVKKSLTNQAPVNDRVTETMESVRIPAKEFANAILTLVPESREQSLALTKLEEAVMWAIKGIALNQDRV